MGNALASAPARSETASVVAHRACPGAFDGRGQTSIRGGSEVIPQSKFKYQHVVDILLEAGLGEAPQELAARVRARRPKGVYPPVRICEDIDHIIRRGGRFNRQNVVLTPEQRSHITALKERMQRDEIGRAHV